MRVVQLLLLYPCKYSHTHTAAAAAAVTIYSYRARILLFQTIQEPLYIIVSRI